jgi:hypothetical protein
VHVGRIIVLQYERRAAHTGQDDRATASDSATIGCAPLSNTTGMRNGEQETLPICQSASSPHHHQPCRTRHNLVCLGTAVYKDALREVNIQSASVPTQCRAATIWDRDQVGAAAGVSCIAQHNDLIQGNNKKKNKPYAIQPVVLLYRYVGGCHLGCIVRTGFDRILRCVFSRSTSQLMGEHN